IKVQPLPAPGKAAPLEAAAKDKLPADSEARKDVPQPPNVNEPNKDDKPGQPNEPAKPPPPPAANAVKMQPWAGAVTPEQQKKIDEAIARGVKFLRDTQFADGSWASTGIHTLGCTALPALTLLECGASPKDPGIVAAATYVRKHSAD